MCNRARSLPPNRAVFRTSSQGARISVTLGAETLSVSLALPYLKPSDVTRTIMLWGLTNLCLTPRRLAGADMRPKEITCTLPTPGPTAMRVLKETFPFRFDAGDNEIVFDRRVGEISIPSADTGLKSLLAEVMDRHLAALGPVASFEEGMFTLLRSMMNGNMPTLASLSARSGMSQRTLQRRLSEANASFQRLLNRVLQEEADELLARGTLSRGLCGLLA